MSCSIVTASSFPLFSLPGELRNIIYEYSLQDDKAIDFSSSNRPCFGTGLMRTCRQAYMEVDHRPLYTNNTLRFNRLQEIDSFVQHLAPTQKRYLVNHIVLSLSAACNIDPATGLPAEPIILTMTHYLRCNPLAHPPQSWCAKLRTLRGDFPFIKRLTLDISGWAAAADHEQKTGSTNWTTLEDMVEKLRELDSIEVTGNLDDMRVLCDEQPDQPDEQQKPDDDEKTAMSEDRKSVFAQIVDSQGNADFTWSKDQIRFTLSVTKKEISPSVDG